MISASVRRFDYTHKRGVQYTEILAPDGAPDWVYDRLRLWNAVEAVEKRRDAQLARQIEVALPVELDADGQRELLRDFVQRAFVSKGMIADLAIHRTMKNNPHAHILLTLRAHQPSRLRVQGALLERALEADGLASGLGGGDQ